ncbi:MAG: hypothetical protein Q4F21_08480 [Lachnospiraceae bacterium]|nr:hypothetical protein [Lachnospiraceae bacterium]
MRRGKIRYGLLGWGIVAFGAFFCCVGIQMIQTDAGALQLEAFSVKNESFLAVDWDREREEQLVRMAFTGDGHDGHYERLLTAVMLKSRFKPQKRLQTAEIFADMLGYERLNEERFTEIASYYKRMGESAAYWPLADVYSSNPDSPGGRLKLLYDAEKEIREMKIRELRLEIPVAENWRGIVPVVCMKTGKMVLDENSKRKENVICLELENGIRTFYENVRSDGMTWKSGEVIEEGQILGSAAAGLILQFQLQAADGSWIGFNGNFPFCHGEKKVRPVTLTNQSREAFRFAGEGK